MVKEARVQSLIGELRSHMLPHVVQSKKEKRLCIVLPPTRASALGGQKLCLPRG